MAQAEAHHRQAVSLDPAFILIRIDTDPTAGSAVAGSFMTSLNLPGFSLTLLLLPRERVVIPETSTSSSILYVDKELMLDLFDAPTDAPAWKWTFKGDPEMTVDEEEDKKKAAKASSEQSSGVKGPKRESCLLEWLDRQLTASPRDQPRIRSSSSEHSSRHSSRSSPLNPKSPNTIRSQEMATPV